jgi:peptide subunit release factor 1 (eRF1)
LHTYLRERLCGRVHVPVGASHAEVRAAAEEVEAAVERDREAALVARLREAAATGRRGVAGLGATLKALNEHRVERLVVSKGFGQEGWRCPETGALAEVGPKNPVNGATMQRVGDVVEDAIEEAITQGIPVTICVGNADLDVLGRIGALLRY